MTTPVNASLTYKKQIATIGSGHYDVTHYGATGDGTTDDSLACQAALDAARDAGGGTVFFPTGTYIIGLLSDNSQLSGTKIKGGLKIGDNVTVCGAGFSSVIKISDEDFTNTTWGKMNYFISDGWETPRQVAPTALTVATAGVATSAGHPYSVGDTVLFTTVSGMTEIDDLFAKVTAADANTYTIDIDTSGFSAWVSNAGNVCDGANENIIIRDLKLNGNHYARRTAGGGAKNAANEQEGIDLINTRRSIITNVYITETTNDSIDLDRCEDILIDGVFVVNPLSEVDQAYNGVHGGTRRITVVNSYFENCGGGRADANTSAVNTAGEGCVVANNRMVGCSRGVYQSAGASNTDIVGNTIINPMKGGIVNVSGVQINITNNAISNVNTSASGVDIDLWGIYTDSTGSNISGNNVVLTSYGIQCRATTGGMISNNSINSSYVGIYSTVATTGLMQITGNKLLGSEAKHAIQADGGPTVISNNIIEARPSNLTRGAINISGTANKSIVSSNIIKGNAVGMAIHIDSDDCVISGNYTEGTSGTAVADINIKGTDCVVCGNRVAGGVTVGILTAATATNVVIYGNNCTGCTDGIDVTTTAPTNPQVAGATGAAANINP